MSTLLIEGGHRLEGRVAVEGNKNAALPLLAACLLTEDECVLTNVPRIGDVEVMARLLLDLGAEVDGIGTTTLRIRAPRGADARARSRAGRPAARLGAAARARCSRGRGKAHIAPPGGDFPARRTISHAPRRAAGDGRAASSTGADHVARGAGRPARRVDVSLRGVGHRHRDGAAGRGDAPTGVTEIRHAATEPHVVELCEFLAKMGAGVTGIGSSKIRIEGVPRLHGAEHRLGGDYIEAGSWAVVGGDHRRRDRDRRRARGGHRGRGRGAASG